MLSAEVKTFLPDEERNDGTGKPSTLKSTILSVPVTGESSCCAETKQVAEFCKESGVAMYSFWSMNRDARLESNKGIYYQYGHTTAASYYLDK